MKESPANVSWQSPHGVKMKILHQIIRKLSGRPQDWAESALARYPFIEPQERYHLQRVAHDILEKSGGEVFSGPLAGLKIPSDSPLADVPMYIIGCYEQEIHPVLSQIICAPPRQIIDIGSAFGYYTVGLALQTADCEVVGFEADKANRWLKALELAALNGVADRITQKGFCDLEALRETVTKGDFIMCDCEGGEADLLDPVKVPMLSSCTMLVEVHDFLAPRSTPTLIDRFRGTHLVRLLTERPRDPSQYRVLDGLSEAYKLLAVSETRHSGGRLTPLRFLHLSPLTTTT
jgi:hypothetical protein